MKAIAKRMPYPKVGDVLPIDMRYVRHDDPTPDNAEPTPMAKIRWDTERNTWRQIPMTQAGMFVFFENEPDPKYCKLQIVSIIPSRTGCYARFI